MGAKAAFVRELARVWQGPAYVAMARRPGRAEYDVKAPWAALDPNQRATLVEDWFRGGMRYDDPRMSHISAQIRRGNR